MLWSEQPFFVSIYHGARLRHLARREVSVQVRARRLREHEVVRGVAGAHVPFGLDHGARVCSRGHQASIATATTQDTLVKTQSLFRICVVVLSSITSRSVAAAAASSLMRFSPSPSCRGDAANPWLEFAFITHFGCVSRHLFVCFFSDRVRGVRTCCLPCRASDSD